MTSQYQQATSTHHSAACVVMAPASIPSKQIDTYTLVSSHIHHTMKLLIVGALLFLSASSGTAWGHSLFNSAEEFYGGYRVQIATQPEFPQVDERSTVLLRVTDADFVEVESMTIGMRVFYENNQIYAIAPTFVEGGHFATNDFVFATSGNHIVKIDLYDMGQEGVLTYTFNLSTQSPFGYIFITSITIGAIMFAILIGYVYLPKYLKSRR